MNENGFFFFPSLFLQLTADPKSSELATRPQTGSTSTVMRFLWTCCVRESPTSLKCTRRTPRCDHWAAVSAVIHLDVSWWLSVWKSPIWCRVACRYDRYRHRRGVWAPGVQVRPCGLLLRLQGHRRRSEADRSHKLPGEESEKETGLDLWANRGGKERSVEKISLIMSGSENCFHAVWLPILFLLYERQVFCWRKVNILLFSSPSDGNLLFVNCSFHWFQAIGARGWRCHNTEP